ncbi:MAG: arabinofuranosyltransferase [Planctomycetota bacterium]|jgi:arabinofuranosyltransferase
MGVGDRMALGLAWLPYSYLVWRFWFVADDAFISFRYARNWATGFGLRYNVGDHVPVEGFSNFLWVSLIALLERLGLDPASWIPAISTVLGFVLMSSLFKTLRFRFGVERLFAALSVLVLGCMTPFAVWTTGGLETMSFALLLFLTLRAAVFSDESSRGYQAGLFGLLTALSRPEGIYWVLLVFAFGHFSRRASGKASRSLSGLTILLVGFGVYLSWRLSVFGHLLPTSATAKLSAGISLDRLERGANYVTLQFTSCLALFALIPATFEAWRNENRALTLPVLGLALGFPVWAILVSGDFMAFGRFLVPGLPFTVLLFGLFLGRIGRAGAERKWRAVSVALIAVVLGVLPAWNVYPVSRSFREAFDFRPHLKGFRSEYAYWNMQSVETGRWSLRGKVLAQLKEPGDSMVLSAIGAVGYYSSLFIYDRVGLVTREVAELSPSGLATDKTPGHDNPVEVKWFLNRGYRPGFVRANFHHVEERTELVKKIARSKFNLEGSDLIGDYVLDVRRVLFTGEDKPASNEGQAALDGNSLTYFFSWRLIPDELSARVAWARFDAQMEAHLEGADLPTVTLPERF